MAFKMKGSAFKLNEVATKSALKQASPMKSHKPGHEPERDPEGPKPPEGGLQMKAPLMQWVYDSSEEIISPVTGEPYPPWVMKTSPEGKYSARARAIEAHNENQFPPGSGYFDWKQENDYVPYEPPPLQENIQWEGWESPAEKGLTSEEYEKTPESEL